MILASLKAAECPYQYPQAIQKAVDWLKSQDLEAMEAGTYEIEGRDIYAMVQEITTQPVDKRRPEKHDLYLDIQYIVSGKERMGYVPYTGSEEILENPEGKDVCFYKNLKDENFVDVTAGSYCVFFSNDIHRPGAAAGEPEAVKKVVLKIKEALL
ncbi:MAG: YhcH/YjgK/YiaL family protein [Lachnospiraceae bacterium]|nr:YhcH/YjgK/YiaL family protein [Lachnospiraceae bacterium]